jgi:hypothetical protein
MRQHGTAWGVGLSLFLLTSAAAWGAEPAGDAASRLFSAAGQEFRFDTGALRGTLRPQGKSLGLSAVVEASSGKPIAGAFGLFSHYRLLDAESRYGTAAWDWPSEARLLPDGAVEVRWTADAAHPFDMKAVYCWKSSNTLDLATSVTPKKDLRRFEVFLASYFSGFPVSRVYARPSSGDPKPVFVEAEKSRGVWQAFPRDDVAIAMIQDGRWKRPPNPVDWTIMPRLGAPLAMRRDDATGLVALLMAPPDDCFAISTPFGEEGHRSVYLSLFGRDLGASQSATARARLVVDAKLTDAEAIQRYEAYRQEVAGR